ncbi:low molecular weight protein-tyrosine-phosphatase [Streptomyces sp. NPDC047023]|uniref:low molecular weight protein-tyrosine-phosphatase n=1 Tax=Streptomyces sp. NPDC047023 TaxID=3155139 RepID=UPI0033DA79D3
MFRVCFVCTGNICRSPMAEHVFRSFVERAGLSHQIAADSAGTSRVFEGYTADVRAAAVLTAAGYTSEHTARLFRPRWLRTRSLVVALDRGHENSLRRLGASHGGRVALLRSFDPEAPPGADVPDPYQRGLSAFEECLEMVEAACAGLLDSVCSELQPAPHRAEQG